MSKFYRTETNERTFHALLDGTKTIEVRTNTASDKINYALLNPGDILEIYAGPTLLDHQIEAMVRAVRHYPDARLLYAAEGIEKTSSSAPSSIAEAVSRIEQFVGYRAAITEHDVFAVELENIVATVVVG